MSSVHSSNQIHQSRTSVEQKIKARNCAMILKNGPTKLRDLLREKCHLKMKESRAQAFFDSRNIPKEKKQLISNIVREELAGELENDIELHEVIMKEILNHWDEWQKEEYENSFGIDDQDQVFCPVCQHRLLNLKENIISCDCGLRLYYPKTLSEFHERILQHVQNHEQYCIEKLHFFSEPKIGFNVLALNTLCPACEYYAPILELI